MNTRPTTAFDALRGYSPGRFTAGVLTGIAVAMFAIPQVVANAMVTGVTPRYGLYAAVIMSISAVSCLLEGASIGRILALRRDERLDEHLAGSHTDGWQRLVGPPLSSAQGT